MISAHSNVWEDRFLSINSETKLSQTRLIEILISLNVKYCLPFSILKDEEFKELVLSERNLILPSSYKFKVQSLNYLTMRNIFP